MNIAKDGLMLPAQFLIQMGPTSANSVQTEHLVSGGYDYRVICTYWVVFSDTKETYQQQ